MSTTGLIWGGLALTAFLLVARHVYPAKNQQGTGFVNQPAARVESPTLSVATFNVQTGKDLHGVRNINRSAAVLADVDLAGVQEVYGAGWLNKLGVGQSQSHAIASKSRFGYLFAATRYRWFREQRGNLTLSKLPVKAWRIEMLPDESAKSPRNMTVAQFLWQGQEITLINTHLHTGRGRDRQLATVIAEFDRHSRVILLGDFNSDRTEPLLGSLLARDDVVDAVAAAKIEQPGTPRIDWVLLKGLAVVGGQSFPKGVSDHPYYEVEVTLVDEGTSINSNDDTHDSEVR